MLFLGVDGGQSATTAMVADESGSVLGVGRAGPCSRLVEALGDSVSAACRQAGVEARFTAACLGLSGGAEGREAQVRALIRADRYCMSHDAAVALTGATGGEPGIITVAGTGSIAYGRNAAGKDARAGGWGHIVGDEGSAFDLVRQAVRAALRFEEGWGPPTSLRDALLEHTGAASANDLLHRFYTPDFQKSKIAAIAPMIGEAATNGDTVARELLHNAAGELAIITTAVRMQLFVPGEKVRVAFVGGVFGNGTLRERFRTLLELEDGVTVNPPEFAPAAGALIEAFQLAGLRIKPRNSARVET